MKVVMYTDGGSRGNPGVAGSGTVVYAADGVTVLREIAYVVGKGSTNNVAEYHGLLRGLEAARDLGATEVETYMDSKLVVEQMSGRWKIKHPDMQKLALEARRIISGFQSFSITWVPRAKNKVADALSNDAMDACAAGHPVGIVQRADAPATEAPSPAPAPASDPETPVPASNLSWLGERGPVTRLVLLRHGATAMSEAHQYAGRTDAELSSAGRAQAAAAARAASRWGVDAIVSSPLQRCRDTAQTVGSAVNLPVQTADNLREMDFGAWEGHTFDEAHQRDPELHSEWLEDTSIAPPGGESQQALHRRVLKARRALVDEYSGKTVLVVSHVGPIKDLLRQALGTGAATVNHIFLDLASVSVVEFWDSGSLVRSINDVSHLGLD